MVVIERLNFRGNPNIGIYAFATDRYAIIPHDADEKFYRYVTRILQVPVGKNIYWRHRPYRGVPSGE